MKTNRTWLWLGGALIVVAGALGLGVPLGTVLTVAALLACPAAMFLGMGMMGRTQGGDTMEHPDGPPGLLRTDTVEQARLPAIPGIETSGEHPRGPASAEGREREDPIGILKLRLAKGDISLEEYERLATAIAGPPPTSRLD